MVLGLKEVLVECATVCVKSWVILIPVVKAGEVAVETPRMKRRLRIYWIFQKILKNPLRKLSWMLKKKLIQSLMTHLNHIFSLA